MNNHTPLTPAKVLASRNKTRFPNESQAYREARNALLADEIELRRQIERVAAKRRQLPPGGAVTTDYRFVGETGQASLSDLFGEKDTLVVYSYMFGPQRKNPCPICTSLMTSLDGKQQDFEQNIALVMVARSPIERLIEEKKALGWKKLKIYSDTSGAYSRDYVSAEDGDVPGYTVFTRRDGTIRHFWSQEVGAGMADPGQDPRGAPDIDPLWTILDTTPNGRDPKWYPKLEY